MELSSGVPDDIDVTRPSAARVYDYFLGGAHNFEVDRQLAAQIASLTPNLAQTMRANRSFLRRAVRYLVAQGIEQFLDLGSGIPTTGNVHEVAQAANLRARVVYVDNEPVAVAHSRHLLATNPYATIVDADLRRPSVVMRHHETRRLLDFSRPVAVLMVSVLHFVTDEEDPAGIVAAYRDALAP